jgi:hypothetical protein
MPALAPEWPGCPKAPGGQRPLPDPAAVRLCLVPDSAPPYDDEVLTGEPPGPGRVAAATAHAAGGERWADGGRRPGDGRADAGQATGASRSPDGGRSADGGEPADGGPGASGGSVTGRPARGGRVTGGSIAGTAPAWPSRFAQVLAETLAGSRPPRQIEPWTTQQAREHIHRLGPRMASVQRPRIRRVVTYRPASDVMEMAVVVGFGPRVRALAVRLERSASSPACGSGGSAGPGMTVSRGRPAVSSGIAGPGEPARHGEPGGRWVCTAVEAA